MAEKIEDLESKLEQAQADIQKMDAIKLEDARSHNEALSDLAKVHREELVLIESESAEKSAKSLQQLDEQTRRHERDLEELKLNHQDELDALKSKSNSDLAALKEERAAEKTRYHDSMEALEISASSKMSNMEAELAAKLATKEEEFSAKLAESERILRQAQDEANLAVEEARRNAQELVASVNTKAEAAKNKVTRECREEILDMKAQFEKKEQQLTAAVMDERLLSEESLENLRSELQAKIELSQKLHADERNDMQATIEKLNMHQETLRSQLESVRIQDEQKMNELTVWKEMHDNQGYCNVTLMADDARKMLEKARGSSERSLLASKQYALKCLQRQFETLQDIRVTCIDTYARVSGQMLLFIDEEMAPKISDLAQGAHSRAIAAYDHALPIYEEHVSSVVLPVYNEYVLPVYKENILPLYNEKVAPAAKPIQKKVKAIQVESEKQMKLARSKAATLVEELARRLTKTLERHKVDQLLPGWLFKHISNLDGMKTMTNLFAFFAFLLCITCRRLILGIVFLPFRVVWFFCPLRLLFRTRSKPSGTVEKLRVNGSSGSQKKSYKAQIE